MRRKLNPWQRLWVMFAGVFLASTLALIAAAWPAPDPQIVADLRAPACQVWRDFPEGIFPDRYPKPADPCHAIQLFLVEQHATLRSEDDYAAYLTATGTGTAMTFLGIWAGLSGGIYILGWTTNRLVGRVLLKQSERQRG